MSVCIIYKLCKLFAQNKNTDNEDSFSEMVGELKIDGNALALTYKKTVEALIFSHILIN